MSGCVVERFGRGDRAAGRSPSSCPVPARCRTAGLSACTRCGSLRWSGPTGWRRPGWLVPCWNWPPYSPEGTPAAALTSSAARQHLEAYRTAPVPDRAARRQGPESSALHGARERVAHWRGESGDPAGAAVAYGALLNEQVRVLGPDHPDTAATRREPARWAP